MNIRFKQTANPAFLALSFAVPAHATAAEKVVAPEFSRSIQVVAQGHDGNCGYAVGDIYIKDAQLRSALIGYIHTRNAVELLTVPDTPAKCVAKAQNASKKDGFPLFRSRPFTDEDQRTNVPPHS